MIFRKYVTKRRSSVKLMFWPRESQVVFLCRFFESNFMDLHLHWCPYRRSGKVTGGRRRKFYLFSSFTQNHCHLCIQTNTIWTCADVWLFNMDTSIPCAWIRSDYLSLSYETIHHILTGLVIRSIFSKPPQRHSNMCLMYVCLSVVVKKKPGLTHVTSKYAEEIKKQREDKRNRKAGTQEETQHSNRSPLFISRSQIEELQFYLPTSRFFYQNWSILTLAGSSSRDRKPKIKIHKG